MIDRYLSGLFVLAVSACTAEPRSAEFFENHPEEAVQVAGLCAAGAKGGDECVNAQAGIAAIEREARQDAYRRQF